MNWEMLAAIGQLAAVVVGIPSLIYLAVQIREQTKERRQSAVNALTVQWGDLTRSLHDNAEFPAIFLRAVQSFNDLDPVSKLRFSAFENRFFKNFEGMYFSHRDGILTGPLWGEIERTMADFLAYPGVQQWWETRKHWHTEEFARLVDEVIAKGHEPKAYATYNLGEVLGPGEGGEAVNLRNFFAELKRRNVYKVAVAYAVVAWLLMQIATQIFPFFEIPNWAIRLVVLLLVIGFPIALVIAWAFELTPEGIKRTEDVSPSESIRRRTGRKLIGITAALAVVATGLLAFQLFRPRLMGDATAPAQLPAAPLVIPEKSIAVLPFENLSDNKDNAYFADGVQDEILTDLAIVADLKVISRTSVMQYRNAAARNLRQIGQQLGVSHVLEGSVQRAANKVRVNAQLIDARNDAHLWAHTYDRDLADVFAIQSEIAETIAEQLQAQLSPREKAAIAEAPTKDIVANDLYVRARALDDLANDPGAKEYLLQGVSLLEEAVRRDPKFLLAYCLMCETHLDLYWYGFDHTIARREQASAALQEAERIQPEAGEVHMHKGLYAYNGFRDYAAARAEFELARRTLPNSSRLYLHLGAVDRRQGRWDDALRNFDRAVELDPRNFVVVEEAAFTNGGLGRFVEARKLLERALEISPKDYFARIILAQFPFLEHADLGPLQEQLNAFRDEGAEARSNAAETYVACALVKRDRAEAEQALTYVPEEGVINEIENFLIPRDWFVGLVARSFGDNNRAQSAFTAARGIEAKVTQEQPDYAPAWSMLGLIDAGLGRKADAMAEGKRACELLPLSKDAWEGPSYVVNLGIIYAWAGEKDLALEQLAISVQNPGGISYGELKLQPFWDSLRGDPRFEKIVASLAPKEGK